MIMHRVKRHKVLLPIHKNCDKIRGKKYTVVKCVYEQKHNSRERFDTIARAYDVGCQKT